MLQILIDFLAFVALKVKAEKVDINRLVNVLTGLNDWKARVDDLDVDNLKYITKYSNIIKWCSRWRIC